MAISKNCFVGDLTKSTTQKFFYFLIVFIEVKFLEVALFFKQARCCENIGLFLWNYGNLGTMELRNYGMSLYTFYTLYTLYTLYPHSS